MPRSNASANEHTHALYDLAARIERVGLCVPVRMILDTLQPVDFLSSQAAVFVQPFVRGSSWERYTAALTYEEQWDTLRCLLDEQNQGGDPIR
jgi:hypothetical protein